MEINKASLSKDVADILIALSVRWEQEDSCYGYHANRIEDLDHEDIFLAEEDSSVLGYLLCHKYIQEKDSCTVPRGSTCLEIEELFVIPERRSGGIGRKLFDFAVSYYGREVQFVTLATATKNYKAILHFYIEELGMDFWSARLFKRLDH